MFSTKRNMDVCELYSYELNFFILKWSFVLSQWSLTFRLTSCLRPHQDPADDWTEHISSSGKKYYYNCRTEVSQWEKPKDLLERQAHMKWLRCHISTSHSCNLVQPVKLQPASCTLSHILLNLLQGTTAERLSQDGGKQFPKGHGLQTRGLAGQSHNK